MSKLGNVEKKIEDNVERAYKAIETGVVNEYKAVEKSVVSAAEKVGDKCVDTLFTRDGESVEEAKDRMKTQAAEASVFFDFEENSEEDEASKDQSTEDKASEDGASEREESEDEAEE